MRGESVRCYLALVQRAARKIAQGYLTAAGLVHPVTARAVLAAQQRREGVVRAPRDELDPFDLAMLQQRKRILRERGSLGHEQRRCQGGEIVGRDPGAAPTNIGGVRSFPRVQHAWVAGWWNLQRGLDITRRQPDLYLKLILLYSVPPLVAAGVSLSSSHDTPRDRHAPHPLPSLTHALGRLRQPSPRA